MSAITLFTIFIVTCTIVGMVTMLGASLAAKEQRSHKN